MRNKPEKQTILAGIVGLIAICVGTAFVPPQKPSNQSAATKKQVCANDESGLTLPPGFCATVFADGIGHSRHMVVASNGVVYVNNWSGAYYGREAAPEGDFLVALQDTKGTGKADVVERFGETGKEGGHGGVGIGIYKGAIYAESNDRIVRYSLSPDAVTPKGPAETVVSGLPLTGDHPMHPFIFGSDGSLYVDVATATNSCQERNRMPSSPGRTPCTELETRGGIWRFDANKTDQKFSPAERFATGIRNAEGLAFDDRGHLLATQHGRDQLYSNFHDLFQPEQEATLPAEELLLVKPQGDYGWPECYYDGVAQKLVLAPEYGGDGKKIGVCAGKTGPIAAFPAHWAPNAMVRYDQAKFPARYRNGVFIAFHGSWNRAPYPQGGYNVVFQPLNGERASGACEIFADGFAGAVKTPGKAEHRPSGLAVGPDGSLYVSDDVRGRIYRIEYRGGSDFDESKVTRCPSDSAGPGLAVAKPAKPPEGTHPNAGAEAARALPPGVTAAMVALGERVYRGQVGGAACTGCHGESGQGSPLAPPLTGKKWLDSDGSYASIRKTIQAGVMQPKQYRSPMPPMGGAQLTPRQVSAVAAYVWSISHPDTAASKR